MKEDKNSMPNLNATDAPAAGSRRWLVVLLPALVVLGGIVIAMMLVETAPRAKREPAASQARLVEVQPVTLGDSVADIEAMGTVVPAREVVLQPQVSGEVLTISDELVPGGRFRKGEPLLRIDPADYELAVRQRESELAQARSNLKIEQGQQAIARNEFELLGESTGGEDNALMLRKPQLESVRASVATAQATLERARLDLARTRIRAPFNAIVQSREVNTGTRVTPVSKLATLIGTDRYWLELSVPVDQLQWLEIPAVNAGQGSAVRVYDEAAWGPDKFRRGHVIRLAGDLENEGRMARVLVAVDDPLALQPEHAGAPVLLLNSYVRAVIEGRTLSNVARVNRALLRGEDRVWLMGSDDRLQIRTVTIQFRGPHSVLVSEGLAAGERLVVTDLSAPVEGMALRTGDTEPPATPRQAPAGQAMPGEPNS
jgi:RND family efflux transporter MFP subunit